MGSGSKYYAIKTKGLKQDSTPNQAGIYVGLRSEGNFTYFYVGQAEDLQERRWEYYQIQCGLAYPRRHFEASLKKHKDGKFYIVETCEIVELNEREKYGISYYMAKPYYVTRNEILTGENKVIQSNKNRIERVEKKLDNKISKCIHNVYTILDSNGLHIKPKTTKAGVPTKLSMKYFNELLEVLKVGK